MHDIVALLVCQAPSNASRWLHEALAIEVPFLQAQNVNLAQAKAFFHAVGQLLLGSDVRLSMLHVLKMYYSHHLEPLEPDRQEAEGTVAHVHACSKTMPALTKTARKEAADTARSVARVLSKFPMETRRGAVMDYLFEKIAQELGLYNVFSIFRTCYA